MKGIFHVTNLSIEHCSAISPSAFPLSSTNVISFVSLRNSMATVKSSIVRTHVGKINEARK